LQAATQVAVPDWDFYFIEKEHYRHLQDLRDLLAARGAVALCIAIMTATLRFTRGQRRQLVALTLREAVFKRDVLAFGEAGFAPA
jgi:hypothetical protein